MKQMKSKYINTYRNMFKDAEFKKIASNFHSFIWNQLSNKQKFNLLKEVEKISSKYFNQPITEIKLSYNNENSDANYDLFNNTIYIDNDYLKNSAYNVLSVYFHEKRHEYQNLAMAKIVEEDEELVKLWQENCFWDITTGISNYRELLPKNSKNIDIKTREYEYFYQPVELDAYTYGAELAFELGASVVYNNGRDDDYDSFLCNEYKNNNYYFGSKNIKMSKIRKEINEKVIIENKLRIKEVKRRKKYIDNLSQKIR